MAGPAHPGRLQLDLGFFVKLNDDPPLGLACREGLAIAGEGTVEAHELLALCQRDSKQQHEKRSRNG